LSFYAYSIYVKDLKTYIAINISLIYYIQGSVRAASGGGPWTSSVQMLPAVGTWGCVLALSVGGRWTAGFRESCADVFRPRLELHASCSHRLFTYHGKGRAAQLGKGSGTRRLL